MAYIGAAAAPQIASLAPGSVETSDLQNDAVTTAKIANAAVTQAKLDSAINLGVKVASIDYPGDDTAANPAGGQTITLNGGGFSATPAVFINSVQVPSVTFVSSNEITFVTPATVAGTYNLYVVNPDGATAIFVNGISFSGVPSWTTPAGSLGSFNAAGFSVSVVATSNSAITYSLTSGSSLPAGVSLSSVGVISGTSATAQTFSFSVDATDAELQETPRSFSITVTLGDSEFEYVTLLLHGDGANATNNKTFQDSSANGFTIIPNGNTTQGTFTPFSKPDGRWSNYFDGSSYITSSSTTAFNSFITGSATGITFTIEAFVFPTVTVNGANPWQGAPIFVKGQTYLNFHVQNDKLRLYWYDQGGVARYVESTASVPLNQWTQVGVTVNGSAVTMYINGVASGTGTFNGVNTGGLNSAELIGYQGAAGNTSSYYGYISNLRVSNIVRTITASTSPLTSDANTIYLTCRNNRFIDASSNGYTFTVTGSGASVQTFSPFPTTASYAAGTNGGSGYFDGSGDYLSVTNNAAFDFGSGDMTLECWFYISGNASLNNSTARSACLFSAFPTSGAITTAYDLTLVGNSSTTGTALNFGRTISSAGTTISYAATISQGSWHHAAVVRSGSTLSLYYDGVRVAQNTSFSGNIDSGGHTIKVGALEYAGYLNEFQGYISGLRVLKGTALYSGATITIPTAPPTAITNTQLLCNFTNGGIIDNSMSNNLETVNQAQISTSVLKYGTGSIYFDGVDDNIVIPYNPVFGFGTGDFTVEGWFYFPTLSTTARGIIALGDGYNGGGPYNGWSLTYLGSEGSNQIRFSRYDGTQYDYVTSGLSLSANTWHHIAVSRSSGAFKIFVDGVSYYSNTVTTSFAPVNTNPLRVALQYYGPAGGYGGPRYWNGYIDDLRITKGYARYTSNFTPPSSAFENNGI